MHYNNYYYVTYTVALDYYNCYTFSHIDEKLLFLIIYLIERLVRKYTLAHLKIQVKIDVLRFVTVQSSLPVCSYIYSSVFMISSDVVVSIHDQFLVSHKLN